MKLLRHPAVHWLLAIVVGGVFVYASLAKIADPRAFAKIVYHYQVIGPSASLGFVPANLLAVALPWLELIAGVLLITGLWRREAAVVTAVMLVVFVAAVASTLARGHRHRRTAGASPSTPPAAPRDGSSSRATWPSSPPPSSSPSSRPAPAEAAAEASPAAAT